MRRILAAFLGIVAMLGAAPAMAALTTNGSGQLTGATGITVNGSTYGVTFMEGNCAGLFSGCDSVSDFTFQTQADAQTAGAALLAAIVGTSFDTAPGTTFGCIGTPTGCFMLIPYGFDQSGSVS